MKELSEKLNPEMFLPLAGGYLRLSREVVNGLFSLDPERRNVSLVWVGLLVLSAPADGVLKYRKKKYESVAGELICSCRELGERIGVHHSTIARILLRFEEMKLIRITPMTVGQRIRVLEYEAHTRKFIPMPGKKPVSPVVPAGPDCREISPEKMEENLKLLQIAMSR